MCDCKRDLEARLLARFKEIEPAATDHQVSLTGYAYFFGKTSSVKGVMPIEQTALFPLKKGGTKRKAVKTSMIFTFCPFCGVRYDAASDDPEEVMS